MGEGDEEGRAVNRLRVAVITTHDRPKDFEDCVAAIATQVDMLAVVAHGMPDYVWEVLGAYTKPSRPALMVIPYEAEVLNISKMWNMGFAAAEHYAVYGTGYQRQYDVAVLNDDAIVPPDWFKRVVLEMRLMSAAAGAAARAGDPRMAGFAFIVDGDSGIRADEQFEWWYGDDDIARQANSLGGVAQPWGLDVEHRHPNSTTVGILAEKARDDRGRYKRKWNLHGI
jgi:GT2 family glycosyltransferase